ncbi:MAG TPA: tetratricopeptide repeat protein [Verrucomicrobiae bacterium]|nr:tetratricopeptide repeat protein [Verrucomicrobiae bacterium]
MVLEKMQNAWRPVWAGAVLLVVLTGVAYLPALRGGFIWDDDGHVTENPTLRSFEGLGDIWVRPGSTQQYYPLVFTSFWMEYQLWKLQPFGYHLVNVLLHALNAVLLWRLLRRLRIPGAWWAAAVFAVHPVTVESVAWITERKNVLSSTFYLLAALAYLRFRPLTGREAGRMWNWRWYPWVLVLFLFALLSKTVTCSLPAVLVLLTWWKLGRLEKRDGQVLAPLFILGLILGFLTIWMEKHEIGAKGPDWELTIIQRCLIAGRALWFYAGKLFWPHDLMFIYPRWRVDAGVAWPYLFPLAALSVLVTLWLLRSRIGKGPLVAVLCFAGTLTPALGFFDVYPFRYSFVADHFQYLACIGLIVLAVSAGATILERAGQTTRRVGMLAAAAIVLLLAASTWGRAEVYRDSETLWQDTLRKNPDCWMAHNNLGVVLARQGKMKEAMGHWVEASRLKPDFAEVPYNVGVALEQAGRWQEAIGYYEQALRIDPGYAKAHNNLGAVLMRRGAIQEAMQQWKQALEINPDFAEAHYNLGIALEKEGKVQEAIGEYKEAVRLNPDYTEAQNGLARLRAVISR